MVNEIQEFMRGSTEVLNSTTFVQTYPLDYQFELLKLRSIYSLVGE